MEDQFAVLVANGPLEWKNALQKICADATNLFAADGGANHLARIGVRPSFVIGDFDSIRPSVREWIGESSLVHRPNQDRTDLDKALSYVFEEREFTTLIVLGALGGRIDHEFANLALLGARSLGMNLIFKDSMSTLIAASGKINLPAQPGETWSFWTLDRSVVVTITGVRWPVEQMSLSLTPSISNIAETDNIAVVAEGGPVFIRRQREH